MLMSAEIARNNEHFELVITISSQFLHSSFHHASYSGKLGHGSDEKNAIFLMAKLRQLELAFIIFRQKPFSFDSRNSPVLT